MQTYLKQQLKQLFQNFRLGVKLSFFHPFSIHKLHRSFDQAVFILLFNITLTIFFEYFQNLPDPLFNIYALSEVALYVLSLLLVAFVIVRFTKDESLALAFFIAINSIGLFFYVLWAAIVLTTSIPYVLIVITLWSLLVVAFIVYFLLDKNRPKTVIVLIVYTVLITAQYAYIPKENYWHQESQQNDYLAKYKNINQETMFYNQHGYLENIRHQLLPERKSVSDIYFVGFAGYAHEDVFMKEVHYIQDLMDNKFNTKGRSIALINNLETMDSLPMATKSNLTQVLQHVGKIINPDEDLLFLYLTSHGSRSHELAVSFWPFSLNQINPTDLKIALDDAGIKWRIILVSACYSGGFIDPLKNENTLIYTASAPDKTSFGCGAKSEFTYFGSAVFKDQLNHHYDLIRAFENATESIIAREKQEKLQSSLPMLYVGAKINTKLGVLQHDLEKYYAKSANSNPDNSNPDNFKRKKPVK